MVERRKIRLMVLGVDLERRQHDLQTLAADEFAQAVVIGEVIGEGAQATDGLERGAPQA